MEGPVPGQPPSPLASRARRLAPLFLIVWVLAMPPWPSATAGPQGGANVAVAVGPENAIVPSLAADAGGGLHVAWCDDRTSEFGVYYATSPDGSTWGAPRRLDAAGMSSCGPSLAVEREAVPTRGRRYVAFQRGTSIAADIVLATSDDGVAWSSPRRIDGAPTGVATVEPVVASSDGRVLVAWTDARTPSVPEVRAAVSSDGGTTWEPEKRLSLADAPSLDPAIAAKGDVAVVVWRELAPSPAIGVAWYDAAAGSWTRSVASFGSPGDEVRDPSVHVDDLGVAHVAWAFANALGASEIRYAWTADGTSWSSPVRVDDGGVYAARSAPSIGSVAGTVWVAWQDDRGGNTDIYASWSWDGLVWGDGTVNGNDVRVDDTGRNPTSADDDSYQARPVLATGGYGVYVVWEDRRSWTSTDVYFGEVLATPLAITEFQDAPEGAARVELYNYGRAPVDLARLALLVGGSRVDLTPLGTAPPRAHLVIGESADADLRVSLNVGTEGASIQLIRDLEVLARAGVGRWGPAPDPLPGESASRTAGTLDYAARWTRSAAPTFGAWNAPTPPHFAPSVVLNEIRYNAADPGDNFIELFFRGTGSLDLDGYRLVGDVEYVLPSVYAGEVARHPGIAVAEAPALFASLDPAGDNVYLYDPNGRLLDMVGWSDAHAAEASVARVVEGAGGTLAFDDASALANGWNVTAPSPVTLELGPEGGAAGNVGDAVRIGLYATNRHASADYVNLESIAPTGWTVALLRTDGTPIADSPGDADATPDLGLTPPDVPRQFLAEVRVPLDGALGTGADVMIVGSTASLRGSAMARLQVSLGPHLEASRSINPDTVYRYGSGGQYDQYADVTVRVLGTGVPIRTPIDHDVVFLIDTSGSMNWADAGNLRVQAVQAYIDGMKEGDRASVIGFNEVAWVVNDRPLTYATPVGKANLKEDTLTLACSPNCLPDQFTDVDAALEKANAWLVQGGRQDVNRVEVLITDGECSPDPCDMTSRLVAEARVNGIVIYTVGLGVAPMQAYLEGIAKPTGGAYFHATDVEDLLPILAEVSFREHRLAGYDPAPTDDVPLVWDAVEPYVTVFGGTFVDPSTGVDRTPAYFARLPDKTVMAWNVSRLDVGQSWAVRYRIAATQVGTLDVGLAEARIAYARWDGIALEQRIPAVILTVLNAPSPPHITATVPSEGESDVRTNTAMYVTFDQPMDAATVAWTISPAAALTPLWPAPRQLWFEHASLRECTTYTMAITAGRDLDGEALVVGPVPNPWGFTTTCTVPYIVATVPRDGEADVPTDAPIIVTFSEPVDPASLSWSLSPPMAATPDLTPDGRVLTLDHATAFAECTEYTAGVGARDLDGNPLVLGPVPNPWRFATPCPTVAYTITRDPPVGSVLVDDSWYAVPVTFAWPVGSAHILSAPAIDVLGPSRLVYLTWDDGGAIDHPITVGAWPQTITARYRLQHPAALSLLGLSPARPTWLAFTGLDRVGTAAPSDRWSGWVDDRSEVRVGALVHGGPGERWTTEDATTWIVTAPLDATVRFAHQFSARIAFVGLGGHRVGVAFTGNGRPASEAALGAWSAWVDAGTVVSTSSLLSLGDRERYRTQDRVEWRVEARMDETVAYVHQYRPRVILVGTDEGHTVAAVWTADRVGRSDARQGEWSEWSDAATVLSFDATTSGPDPRATVDPVAFPVASAFDAVIRYVGQAPPVPVGTNWKPLVSIAYTLAILAFGYATEGRGDRVWRRLRIAAPFAVAELAIGVVSWRTRMLGIPEAGTWLSTGFWVNTGLLTGALAIVAVAASRAASRAVPWRRGEE